MVFTEAQLELWWLFLTNCSPVPPPCVNSHAGGDAHLPNSIVLGKTA